MRPSCTQCRRRRVGCQRDGPPCSACIRRHEECEYPQYPQEVRPGTFFHNFGPGTLVIDKPPTPPLESDQDSQGPARQSQNNLSASTWLVWKLPAGQASGFVQGSRSAFEQQSPIRERPWYEDCRKILQRDCSLSFCCEKGDFFDTQGRALHLLIQAISIEPGSIPTREAVYIMAILEMITCEDVHQRLDHMNGAVAMMLQQNRGGIQDKADLAFIVQVKLFRISQSLLRQERVPDDVLEPIKIASGFEKELEAYGDRLTYILGRLSHLWAGTQDKTKEEIYRQAWLIQFELEVWRKSLPQAPFKSESLSNPQLPQGHGIFYHNPYRTYNDIWTCHIWNQYLCARIIVLHIISPPRSDILRRELQPLISEICANIPFHFDIRTTGMLDNIPTRQFTIRGLLLLWPLVVIGTTGDKMRQWAKDCFRVLGEKMGIRQSLALERGGIISKTFESPTMYQGAPTNSDSVAVEVREFCA
ncbi:hypothetical protein BDW69DRAFT_101118 [Aspergillus filifer]